MKLSPRPAAGRAQIFTYGAFCVLPRDQLAGTPGGHGDLGFRVLTSSLPEQSRTKVSTELADGRLAMRVITGMFSQDRLIGPAWRAWALYTASPLRDFENEWGSQDPSGFWDPGYAEHFRRRRQAKLNPHRVPMLDTMGYITPEFTGNLPPSMGIRFSDVPNGLDAFSKGPLAGWLQIVAVGGLIENTERDVLCTPDPQVRSTARGLCAPEHLR